MTPSSPTPVSCFQARKNNEILFRFCFLCFCFLFFFPRPMQGLPPEWRAMLQDSGISAEEVMQHPQAVADVINFQLERQRASQRKELQRSRSLEFDTVVRSGNNSFETYRGFSSSSSSGSEFSFSLLEKDVKGKGKENAVGTAVELGDLISRDNPKTEFTQLQKIGEGASGTVHLAQDSAGRNVRDPHTRVDDAKTLKVSLPGCRENSASADINQHEGDQK